MYAVIRTGGKQYRVEPGRVLRVERLEGSPGDLVELRDVLWVDGPEVSPAGPPPSSGAKVLAEIVEQGKGPKVLVFKMRRRKGYRRKQGHRQLYTLLRIKEIVV